LGAGVSESDQAGLITRMRAEDQLLFLAARQDLTADHRAAIQSLLHSKPVSWEKVFSTAQEHRVAPLVYINLVQKQEPALDIPDSIIKQQRLNIFHHVKEKEHVASRLAETLALINAHSLRAMLVKGSALDLLVYDKPWYTAASDVDLILDCTRQEFDQRRLEHIEHKMAASSMEYDFYEHHDVNINGALPVDFKLIWGDAVKLDHRGQAVYVMCPEDMLISLCINSCRKRFFRLKSLCDIAETVRKFPQLSWAKLVDRAKRYDCLPIVYTALRVTELTVRLQLPAGTPDLLKIGWLRKTLIEVAIRYLLRTVSLSAYPFTGRIFFNRQLHLSLILPYLNYRGYQVWRKLDEIQHAQNLPRRNVDH
jgi:hypothetical protein